MDKIKYQYEKNGYSALPRPQGLCLGLALPWPKLSLHRPRLGCSAAATDSLKMPQLYIAAKAKTRHILGCLSMITLACCTSNSIKVQCHHTMSQTAGLDKQLGFNPKCAQFDQLQCVNYGGFSLNPP